MRLQSILKTSIVVPLGMVAFVAVSAPLSAHAQQQRVIYAAPATYNRPVIYAQPTTRSAYYYPPAPTATTAQPARTATYTGDPYGFTNWLNGVRAQYGLPAVGHDQNLTNWAAANNSQQQVRGMGHHVMGPARRQNSAMGAYGTIGSMWLASPGHRAALLDPSIRMIGIAGMGAYWTFNAY